MKWTPRRIALHVAILIVALALPLFLSSSCGKSVHSESGLIAGISH
jgi:hypothetical protein